MRTMILFLVINGSFPTWLLITVSIWYVLSCAGWWYKRNNYVLYRKWLWILSGKR